MGNPFVHIELNTGDVAKASKFYKTLFAWKLGPLGPDYTGIDVGKGTGGGMQATPTPGAPPNWLPYVEVDDVKKTMAKAKKLGATINVEYMEIGPMGAIGVLTDPTGAAIGVWAQAKKATKAAKRASKKAAKAKKGTTKAAKKAAKKK